MKKENDDLILFDAVDAAKNPRVQTELLNMAWNDGNLRAIAHALKVIAKARGMKSTAEEAGISRTALYKSLSEKGNPSLSSLIGIMKALGVTADFKIGASAV